ncbi:MAG TPA: response regulator [Thermoanaerobaculia bacterium]|jgi:CheY-like chemotaxis protein
MRTNAALAVDDDATILRLIAALLRRAGFDPVHTARDGQECLDLLAANTYCVVILDLRMPRVSGYDVIARLAADPLPQMPTIVVATADRSAAGNNLDPSVVTAVLTKPFRHGDVAHRGTNLPRNHLARSGLVATSVRYRTFAS